MATNTINDLYLKYANKVGRTLENDRYFQYLFEMVQAGENVLQQNNQILHKVVDEKWLSTIEESLDAINTIIEKPRRFVTTKEEVVPVALAKKITADSVRHLSMNTQFIASSEEGDIQPTRVLNVSTEESYDLYENRFVYHLIQRLVTFIDKRTDVIFWATGDETQNVLSYQSKVDDAYEEIEYKIEMKVKNRQSFAENDADNMGVFMRIDRVRRMVMALKNSAFCGLMAGCSKVRSPIQRTNLIMKDPNYRTCYRLWQFLESYDDVGYTIEVENVALQFDEEYLIQMYTNLITNYTVFKSLLESDSRKLEEVLAKKRRVIKPKFIKKIKEEIVDDYNLEDVEIRQVIIEEVTQAQLDAEAKLQEETRARKQAEEALEDMDSQMVFLQQQVSNLMMQNQEAEIRAEQERQEKENALAQTEALREQATAEREEAARRAEEDRKLLEETKAQAEQKVLEIQTQADRTVEENKARAEQKVLEIQTQAKTQISEMQKDLEDTRVRAQEELQTTRARLEESRSLLEETKAQASRMVEETQARAQQRVEEIQAQAQQKIVETQDDANHRIAQTQAKAAEEMAKLQQQTREIIDELRRKADQELASLQQEKSDREAEARETREQLSSQLRQTIKERKAWEEKALLEEQKGAEERKRSKEELEELQSRKDREIADLKEWKERLEQRILEAEKARELLETKLADTQREAELARQEARAEKERADANTLSHYLISAWNERRRRNDKGGEDE